jgi:hypothetical protein
MQRQTVRRRESALILNWGRPVEMDIKLGQHIEGINVTIDAELLADVGQGNPAPCVWMSSLMGNEYPVMNSGICCKPAVSAPGKFVLRRPVKIVRWRISVA